MKCDGKLAAWGIQSNKRLIHWTGPSSGEVKLIMLAASSYGPVDFYEVTLQPNER